MTSRRTRVARLLALAALGLVLLLLSWAVFVRTGVGQRLDDLAFEGRKATYLSVRRAAALPLRWLTVPAVVLGTLTGIVASARRGRWVDSTCFALSVVSAIGISRLLKGGLERPALVELAWAGGANTFPSGYSSAVVTLLACAVLYCDERIRFAVTRAAVILAGAYALAMVGTGWHRPSDVLGGTALALTITTGIGAVATQLAPTPRSTSATSAAPPRGPRALLGENPVSLWPVVVSLPLVSLALVLGAENPPPAPGQPLGLHLLASGAAVAAAASSVWVTACAATQTATSMVSRSET